MKYVDEYRDNELAKSLVSKIQSTATRRWVLMDVCGGQTHGLVRHGIEEALADDVELIHGPGCPVCVTSSEAIDFAQQLATRDDVLLCSFGDMMRVPGSCGSLLDIRSQGGHVAPVYTPMDAVTMASEMPDRQVVFFAVGFETTAPATALAVLQAERKGLTNFSMLVSHVRVLPAMETLMTDPENRVQGFLAAGHVCTITGYEAYTPFANQYSVPVVITGFEPIDLLRGIHEVVSQLEAGRHEVVNRYQRSVREEGNLAAMKAIDKVYEIADQSWRGFGVVASGGLRLRSGYERFDAAKRFDVSPALPMLDQSSCRSGDVLAGRIKPTACEHFAGECHPDHPLGAPMVSSEGACAAYYRYRSHHESLTR